jgi:hypothetical protein
MTNFSDCRRSRGDCGRHQATVNIHTTIKVGFWNMLSDGLSQGEFLSSGGDANNTTWDKRKVMVVSVLRDMLTKCDVVGVVENDHFHYLLNELNEHGEIKDKIGGLHRIKKSKLKKTPSYMLRHTASPERTFKSEKCPSNFTAMYDAAPDNAYNVDDGISLFYRKDKWSMPTTPEPGTVMFNDTPYLDVVLSTVFSGNKKYVHVYVAHLSSGEGDKDNETRQVELARILLDIKVNRYKNDSILPILMMDSNYSTYYKGHEQMDTLLHDAHFKNNVDEKGNECFKMRHAKGEQPSKFGSLMFDALDKICVPDTHQTTPINFDVFAKYNFSLDEYHKIAALRKDQSARSLLTFICMQQEWGDDFGKAQQATCAYKKETITNDSVDKVIQKITDDLNITIDKIKNSLDGAGTGQVDIQKMKHKMGQKMKQREKWLRFTDGDTFRTYVVEAAHKNVTIPTDCLTKLYPNKDAPSDHPPVGVSVSLESVPVFDAMYVVLDEWCDTNVCFPCTLRQMPSPQFRLLMQNILGRA